jgi:hypothetical protein
MLKEPDKLRGVAATNRGDTPLHGSHGEGVVDEVLAHRPGNGASIERNHGSKIYHLPKQRGPALSGI